MQGIGWISALIIGGLAGWAASSLMRADTGLVVNILLGILGAIVANFAFGFVGVSFSPSWIGQGVAGLVGAVILIFLARALRR